MELLNTYSHNARWMSKLAQVVSLITLYQSTTAHYKMKQTIEVGTQILSFVDIWFSLGKNVQWDYLVRN